MSDKPIKSLKDYEKHKGVLKGLEHYKNRGNEGVTDETLDDFRNKIRDFEAKLENPLFRRVEEHIQKHHADEETSRSAQFYASRLRKAVNNPEMFFNQEKLRLHSHLVPYKPRPLPLVIFRILGSRYAVQIGAIMGLGCLALFWFVDSDGASRGRGAFLSNALGPIWTGILAGLVWFFLPYWGLKDLDQNLSDEEKRRFYKFIKFAPLKSGPAKLFQGEQYIKIVLTGILLVLVLIAVLIMGGQKEPQGNRGMAKENFLRHWAKPN